MPKQISSPLKNLSSGVKGNKPPELVMQVQKRVKHLNYLVKSFLTQEKEVVLSKEVQANALQGVVAVNRLYAQLSQNYRSDHHLQMYREQFLEMKERIQGLAFCVNLSIENGFFPIESRGFYLAESLQVSWQEVQAIHRSLIQSKERKYFPYFLKHNGALKKQVHGLYQALMPTATEALKLAKKGGLTPFFQLEQLKIINRFFKQTAAFHQAIQEQYLDAATKNKVFRTLKIENIDHLSKELRLVEQTIHRYNKGSSLLVDSVRFDEQTAHDLYARMHAIHVQLESFRFLAERRRRAEELLAQAPSFEVMKEFAKTMGFEKKQLGLFIQHFLHINQTLRAMSSILSNLSISFGKIFQLSLKSNLTPDFLTRAFQTTHNLLSKGIKLAEAQKSDSQQLKLALQKATLFQKPVVGMIFSAFKELEAAKQEIVNYDQKLLRKLQQASQQKELPRTMIQTILKEAYEDRTELSNASIGLHNISENFALLIKELKTIESILQQIPREFASEQEAKQGLEKAFEILQKAEQCPPQLLHNLWMSAQHLHWYVEEIILDNLRENRRFQESFEAFIAPVQKRIAAQTQPNPEALPIPAAENLKKMMQAKEVQEKSKTALQGSPPQAEKAGTHGAPKRPLPDIVIPEKPLVSDKARVEKSAEAFVPVQKSLKEIAIFEEKVKKQHVSIYDPFVPTTMKDLKIACHAIGTAAILSVLEVLERPHAFFDFLERLEAEYDPQSPFSEALWMVEVEESQSAMDFILGFAKVKFLPYGYFDPNGVELSYDKTNKRIQKPIGKQIYLKISSRYMDTPRGIFQRLMRILLGYEKAHTLGAEENRQLINILEMDYVITETERKQLHDMVPFVGG